MTTKITLTDGQVYRLGDVYRGRLDADQFAKDDAESVAAICELHNADLDSRELATVAEIADSHMLLSAGNNRARFVYGFDLQPEQIDLSAEKQPEPEVIETPVERQPEQQQEPKKRRGRPRKVVE
ncbi:MAG: hypothetical protein VW907_08495 [Opitutae bacterium]